VEPLEYLRILRRRKLFVALAVLVGVIAGWVSAPGHTSNAPPSYRATHTLILASTISTKAFNLEQAALLVTTGAVPQAVATKVGGQADPIRLAKKVVAKPNATLGTIDITATDTDPAFAVALADDFAQGLVDDQSASGLQTYEAQHSQLQSQVADLQAKIDALGPVDTHTTGQARTQFDALSNQLSGAQGRLTQLEITGPPAATFSTLQSARAILVTNSGFKPPDSKPARAALLGIIGLLLGIGLAFAAERLETRLTTKSSAETAFGLPVVAEIPNLPNAKRHKDELMTATQPAAPFVESYRGLRTMVLLRALDDAQTKAAGGEGRTGKVLVVVSPGAGEGKTTTAAHLAALLAEAGNSVLVVSADFRRPRIHELFAVNSAPGLSEVLAPRNPLPLRSLDLSTPVKGVKLLASGAAVDNPAPLLGATVELMRGARPLFDFIIVDTAPLLVANDASELIRAADMVLVVARARRTSIDSCERSAELLKRIDAPVIGAVLVGASDMPAAYRYYRYRYYGASSPPSLSQRLRGSPASKGDNEARRRVRGRDLEQARDRDENAATLAEPAIADAPFDAAAQESPRQRRRQRDQKTGRNGRRSAIADVHDHEAHDLSAPDQPHDAANDLPIAEPAPVASPTNGAGEHGVTDESLSEFWQEFKERR